MRYYGRSLTRPDVEARAGDVAQLAGVRPVELQDGPHRGVRALEFRTGAGLQFWVLCDRGMDIGPAEYRGLALCWHSAAGPVHPAYYEPEGGGWRRPFPGGLLTTCGLSNVGPADMDDGESYGHHGRISHTPARQVAFGSDWEGDDYRLWARGEMRQTHSKGENLVLVRRIEAVAGEPSVTITDQCEDHAGIPHLESSVPWALCRGVGTDKLP